MKQKVANLFDIGWQYIVRHIVGLATRLCVGVDEWADPDISDCTTIEQIRLGAQIREIERIIANMFSNETRDLTERFESQVVMNIARELNMVTNTSVPLVPNDIGQTNQTLGSIVK